MTHQVEDVKKFLADPDAYAAANPVAAAPAAGGAAEAKKEEKKAQICVFFGVFAFVEEPSWKLTYPYLLGQWLNFKLFGITYLVGKIKFKLFFQGPLAE